MNILPLSFEGFVQFCEIMEPVIFVDPFIVQPEPEVEPEPEPVTLDPFGEIYPNRINTLPVEPEPEPGPVVPPTPPLENKQLEYFYYTTKSMCDQFAFYFSECVYTQLVYHWALHTFILNSKGMPYPYGDLYEMFNVQQAGIIATSVSDSSSHTSLTIGRKIQEGDMGTALLYSTKYGQYVLSIIQGVDVVITI